MSDPVRPAPPRPPAGSSRYGWAVGVLAVVILAYITLNTLHTGGGGPGIRAGERLPPFAAPLLASSLDGDANVATTRGQGAGRSGKTTACEVTDPRALNICRAEAGHRVVLAFADISQRDSVDQLDAMQAESRRVPGVRFLAVFLKGSRGEARKTAVAHGWTFPIAWDHDAAVATAYGVNTVPTVVFAGRRGRVTGVAYHALSAGELARRLAGAATG